MDYYLKDFVFPGDGIDDLVRRWDFVPVNDDVRIYYKLYDPKGVDKSGFMFAIVEWSGGESLDDEDVSIDCLYWGYAFFDGLRHLYMGAKQTGNNGYSFWPDLDVHVECLAKLKTLVEQHCDV